MGLIEGVLHGRSEARRGAWFVAARAMMHTALSKRNLQRDGFVMPSDLAAP